MLPVCVTPTIFNVSGEFCLLLPVLGCRRGKHSQAILRRSAASHDGDLQAFWGNAGVAWGLFGTLAGRGVGSHRREWGWQKHADEGAQRSPFTRRRDDGARRADLLSPRSARGAAGRRRDDLPGVKPGQRSERGRKHHARARTGAVGRGGSSDPTQPGPRRTRATRSWRFAARNACRPAFDRRSKLWKLLALWRVTPR